MKRLANHLVALISAAAAIAAVTSLLASEAVRIWARNHSSWVYAGLIAAAFVALLAVDFAIGSARRYHNLKASLKVVSAHDKRLLREILALLPLDGEVMTWLKSAFFVKQIPVKSVDAIREVSQQLNLHPVGFDNPQVADAYQKLIAAIEALDAAITRWASYEDDSYSILHVPLSMKESKRGEELYYVALKEIADTVTMLVGEYDDFLGACRRSGMSIYDTTNSV
jgi:hypothetical protein